MKSILGNMAWYKCAHKGCNAGAGVSYEEIQDEEGGITYSYTLEYVATHEVRKSNYFVMLEFL